MSSHSYTLSSFNSLKLLKEVQTALALTPTISALGPQVVISFAETLDSNQEVTLSSIVAAHDGTELPKPLINDYLTANARCVYSPPTDKDFITGLTVKLHRKQTMVKGEIQVEDYYLNYNESTHVYSDLIVRESHVFTRDSLGFATKRTTTIQWMMNNGQFHETTKVWAKHYDNLQMIEEGIQRRGNIIKSLQPTILYFLQLTLSPEEMPNILIIGRTFLTDKKDYFQNFVDHSDRAVSTHLNPTSNPQILIDYTWLDNVIPGMGTTRIVDYILNELNI